MSSRRTTMIGDLDLRTLRGAEIGALNKPLVRREEGEILYVDYAGTPTLREQHRHAGIDLDEIVEVDVVWGDRPLLDCVPDREPFDYVLASHVIEHVPDLIGWLADMAAVLKPGGLLGLAIPDRRHTFDFARNESTVGEMVEAFLHRYRMPSIRQVFDHCFGGVQLDMVQSWSANPAAAALRKFMDDQALPLAMAQAQEIAIRPRYIDSHCWVFTPEGFLRNLLILAQLRHLPFTVEHVRSTAVNDLEFFLRLRRAAPDDPAIAPSIEQALVAVQQDPSELAYAAMLWRGRH